MHRKRTKVHVAYLGSAALSLAVIGSLAYFQPSLLPFGFLEFWALKGSLYEIVVGAWPIYLFGILFNLPNVWPTNGYKDSAGTILMGGFGISLWAGVAEEICFRWLIFLGLIVLMPIFDWLLLGFIGVHVIRWVYECLSVVANFFTFGYLQPYLLNGYGWAVAAAIMSSNGRFRNGHSYQGLCGFTVSWFLGMYFFWTMFTYGLVASIIVHFLYDFFIFALVSLDAMQEQWRTKRRLASRKSRTDSLVSR